MTINKLSISILSLLFFLGLSTGCAKYATSGKMMDRIEKKATPAISEQEFKDRIPSARLVSEEGSRKVYLVAFGEPCFICGSGKAFLRSFEPYATQFTFIDGSLSSSERLVMGE